IASRMRAGRERAQGNIGLSERRRRSDNRLAPSVGANEARPSGGLLHAPTTLNHRPPKKGCYLLWHALCIYPCRQPPKQGAINRAGTRLKGPKQRRVFAGAGGKRHFGGSF